MLFQELKVQIDRMNAGEKMENIPKEMVEYRAEEFLARQALLDGPKRARRVASEEL